MAQRSFVVDSSNSPFAKLRPAPLSAVRLNDRFWSPRMEINRTVTLPSQYEQCEETGRIDNFRRASGRKKVDFQGIYFNDSDVYKWVEAASFSLASYPDAGLESKVDLVVDEIAVAQGVDGYLNSYFTFERAAERWTNLRDLHELYCAGHLIQAAVAHHRATGKSRLLNTSIRFATHICETFGPDRRPGACGHEEIEMALVELYRETGRKSYLEEAAFFIDQRGRKPAVLGGSSYHQDHLPFRELGEMVGHAVRMVYLNCGAADLLLETGDPSLRAALDRLWDNMVGRRMYVTGGLGSRYEGEAFGRDFELPNDRAYAESCAAIGSIFWCWRMLLATGDARYTDVLEHSLYNGMLPGLSLDGKEYFYQNPLSDDGHHRRQPWFGCACCPPNLSRMIASLPGYCYTSSENAAWVHLYAAGTASIPMPDGSAFGLRVSGDYPWDGRLAIEVTEAPDCSASLHLRIPGWCTDARVAVNGHDEPVEGPARYVCVDHTWKAGDRVELDLPMEVRRVSSHPWLASNYGQVALLRGPLVYCLESADHPGVDIRDVVLAPSSSLDPSFDSALLGGVVRLDGEGWIRDSNRGASALYRTDRRSSSSPGRIRAIPYFAWANRDPGPMKVWIPLGA